MNMLFTSSKRRTIDKMIREIFGALLTTRFDLKIHAFAQEIVIAYNENKIFAMNGGWW